MTHWPQFWSPRLLGQLAGALVSDSADPCNQWFHGSLCWYLVFYPICVPFGPSVQADRFSAGLELSKTFLVTHPIPRDPRRQTRSGSSLLYSSLCRGAWLGPRATRVTSLWRWPSHILCIAAEHALLFIAIGIGWEFSKSSCSDSLSLNVPLQVISLLLQFTVGFKEKPRHTFNTLFRNHLTQVPHI